MTDRVVELSHVRREYQTGDVPTVALADVSLEVRRGEFVAIVGPSGSGKSTLMNLIGCLDRPSAGTVKIAGNDISTLDDNQLTAVRSKAIGFVFQQFQLLPLTSAVDNVAAPLLYQGLRPREAQNALQLCSPAWVWATGSTLTAVAFRVDSSSEWPFPALWSLTPTWSWPMSPPERSTLALGQP